MQSPKAIHNHLPYTMTMTITPTTTLHYYTTTTMHVHGTATVLMRAVQASPFTSLFAKDQVATVLANLAAREECRASILQQDGLGFLLSLLATSPGSSPTQAEAAAAERVLKKAAIALSR